MRQWSLSSLTVSPTPTDIQVIGGLIENEDVRIGVRDHRKRNPRFLPSAQRFDLPPGHIYLTASEHNDLR